MSEGTLKKVECDPKCVLWYRAMTKRNLSKELIEIAKQHAKKSHNMALTENDIKSMIKDV